MSNNIYNIEELKELRKKIDILSENEQIEIYKLLKENECKYTLNKNGVFIKMNLLPDNIINKLEEMILFSKENNEKLKETEEILNEYKQ